MVKIFENVEMRIKIIDDAPWFMASDVCKCLDLKNVGQAISGIEKDDIISSDVIDTIGRTQMSYMVNESGLYELIFKSRKQSAKEFKRWVTHDVLPSIRKTGKYSISDRLTIKSRETRNFMTETWKSNGVKIPSEYAMLTTEEYKLLQFEKGKRKKDFTKEELLLLQALESLESLNLHYNPAKGFLECKESMKSTVNNIKGIIK